MTAPQPKFGIERLDAKELANFPRLPELYHMINRAFRENRKKHPDILRPKEERFNSEQQLLDELGSDIILFLVTEEVESEESSTNLRRIVATASYKPYKEKETGEPAVHLSSESKSALFDASKTRTSDEGQENATEMEVVAVVVAPEWQRHGLASQLLQAIADEVKNKARTHNDRNQKPKLWARTAKEINERFWKRQGFRTVEARFFEAGLFGSVKGFHMVTMIKELAVA
ncbi:MAG: hypothetical protein Q9191_005651 [Dirinaria sp. TL-2023a]